MLNRSLILSHVWSHPTCVLLAFSRCFTLWQLRFLLVILSHGTAPSPPHEFVGIGVISATNARRNNCLSILKSIQWYKTAFGYHANSDMLLLLLKTVIFSKNVPKEILKHCNIKGSRFATLCQQKLT